MKFEITVSSPEQAREISDDIKNLYLSGMEYRAAYRLAVENYKKSQSLTDQSKGNDHTKKFNSIISSKGVNSNGSKEDV